MKSSRYVSVISTTFALDLFQSSSHTYVCTRKTPLSMYRECERTSTSCQRKPSSSTRPIHAISDSPFSFYLRSSSAIVAFLLLSSMPTPTPTLCRIGPAPAADCSLDEKEAHDELSMRPHMWGTKFSSCKVEHALTADLLTTRATSTTTTTITDTFLQEVHLPHVARHHSSAIPPYPYPVGVR